MIWILLIIFVPIIGAVFGYEMYLGIEQLKRIAKALDRPLVKSSGVTVGKFADETKSSAHVIVPKSPQDLEAERVKELREQGYNIE